MMGSALNNLKQLHRAGLCTDAAGDALGRWGAVLGFDNQMERAGLNALATAGAELLVDHVYTLRILGDGTGLAGLGTLAALHAHHGLYFTLHLNDLDAGFRRIRYLVKRF